MAKSNPLFVDSTLHTGDQIDVQIELNKILLYEAESLYVLVTNHSGEELCYAMHQVDNHTFETPVRLTHSKKMKLQFVIEKDAKVLFRSSLRDRTAQYALIESWDLLSDQQDALTAIEEAAHAAFEADEDPRNQSLEAYSRERRKNNDRNQSPVVNDILGISSLMEKWGF